MKQLILLGTARANNKSRAVANAVKKEFSAHHKVKLFDLGLEEVPTMRKRLSHDDNPPQSVSKFSEQVEWCDLLTIVTPEYNHSIPGVLKNCLDYLYNEYNNKPFSYVTVSAGGFGGVRCQSHLHDITLALGGRPGPSLPVSNVNEHFDGSASEEYIERINEYREKCEAFIDQTE